MPPCSPRPSHAVTSALLITVAVSRQASTRSSPRRGRRAGPMTRADTYLLAAAKEPHEAALERSASALRSLEHAGLPVTFKPVAERADVSRN